MSLKNILLGLSFSLLITACNSIKTNIYEHFDDRIASYDNSKKYGTAFGLKGVYVYYGTLKTFKGNLEAGTAVTPTKVFHYPIVELLQKYPQLKNEKSIKAAAVQLELLRRKQPGFYDTIELGALGEHGR